MFSLNQYTMKLKKLNRWFTRVLLIGLMALVGGGVLCRDPYTTNPNLRLLVGDTTTKYDAIHCSNPVVSPNGNTIYYLCAPSDSLSSYNISIGAIYAVDISRSNNEKILDGKFNALAISSDGNKLAIHPYKSYYYLEPDSFILIFDLPTSKIDSYPILNKRIIDIEFTRDNQLVYYSVVIYTATLPKIEFYRLHLSDSTNELCGTIEGLGGFDLFADDSIYIDSSMQFPQINPVQEAYAIGSVSQFDLKLSMRDITKDTLLGLPDSLKPYDSGLVGQPYWFPDGNTIVFATSPYSEPLGKTPAEIWMLTNFFEQVDTTDLK